MEKSIVDYNSGDARKSDIWKTRMMGLTDSKKLLMILQTTPVQCTSIYLLNADAGVAQLSTSSPSALLSLVRPLSFVNWHDSTM